MEKVVGSVAAAAPMQFITTLLQFWTSKQQIKNLLWDYVVVYPQ